MRLYVKRVFINDKFEDLVPRWLTFVRGVVDSEDLPLNVGREILQKSQALSKIQNLIVRKFLDTIADLKESEPAKFLELWSMYGKYFKVGLIEDFNHKAQLKQFVRFLSSKTGDNTTSLSEYVSRMKDGQDKIYFISGEGKRAVEIAPAMEKIRSLGYEVLYLVDPLDEICGNSAMQFDGHEMVDINKAGFSFNRSDEEKDELEANARDFKHLASWLKKELAAKVQDVHISDRLVDSPAVLVQGRGGTSPMMQRYMNAQATSSGQDTGMKFLDQAILEVNSKHPAIEMLKTSIENSPDAAATKDMAMTLYQTAALIGGYPIDDLGDFANRIVKLMEIAGASSNSAASE